MAATSWNCPVFVATTNCILQSPGVMQHLGHSWKKWQPQAPRGVPLVLLQPNPELPNCENHRSQATTVSYSNQTAIGGSAEEGDICPLPLRVQVGPWSTHLCITSLPSAPLLPTSRNALPLCLEMVQHWWPLHLAQFPIGSALWHFYDTPTSGTLWA